MFGYYGTLSITVMGMIMSGERTFLYDESTTATTSFRDSRSSGHNGVEAPKPGFDVALICSKKFSARP